VAVITLLLAAPIGSAGELPVWPTAKGDLPVTRTITVEGTRDGGMVRFRGSGPLATSDQDEDQKPLFELADGATLENVILGHPAADGVHCRGSCTLRNVWWEDVGEDAATFTGTSPSQTATVEGGGARGATDKVFQHNGPGRFVIRNFQVSDFGKLYRSCGNCPRQYPRRVLLHNVIATAPGKTLVGINANYGDRAELTGITIVADPHRKISLCDRYRGVTRGEPTRIGSGPDGVSCRFELAEISYR
jgi:hypothetical protein